MLIRRVINQFSICIAFFHTFDSGEAIASLREGLSGVEALAFLQAICTQPFIGVDVCWIWLSGAKT